MELETGISTNEPGLIALTKAIEKAVHSLVLEGADLGLWSFADESAARTLINEHRVASGRSALPDLTERQIAQKVDTKVEVDTEEKAESKAEPTKPATKPLSKKPVSEEPKASAKLAREPVGAASAETKKTTEVTAGATKTKRVLPTAQQSHRKSVPVKNGQQNSTTATVPIVTKVSP